MDAAEVSRRRLNNLQLARPQKHAGVGVVRRLLAMQSQDYGPAKWSIAQRCRSLSDKDLDAEIDTGAILRTHVLRPTWHFVAAEDIRWLLRLTGPRIAKLIAPRLGGLGLDALTLTRGAERIASVLEGGRHLTRDAIGAELERAGIDVTGQRLPHILMHCELQGLICSGPPEGKKQTYALLDERAGDGEAFDAERAVVELVRRYLAGHGPATVDDLRWWSSLTVAVIRGALAALGSEVSSAEVDGSTFWWVEEADEQAPDGGARLLQTYDEFIVGYRQSRFVGDVRASQALAAWKDRSVPNGLLLIEGKIAGHWRRKLEPARVRIDIVLYARLRAEAGLALEDEVAALGRHLRRPAEVEMTTL